MHMPTWGQIRGYGAAARRRLSWLRAVPFVLIAGGFVGLAATIAHRAANVLPAFVADLEAAEDEDRGIYEQNPAALFGEAMRQGVIAFDADGSMALALLHEAPLNAGPGWSEAYFRLVDSKEGRSVLEAIRAWNSQLATVALRDTLKTDRPPADGFARPISGPEDWDVRRITDAAMLAPPSSMAEHRRRAVASIAAAPGAPPLPQVYGMLTWRKNGVRGDWIAGAAEDGAAAYEFTRAFDLTGIEDPETRRIEIDFAGRFVRAEILTVDPTDPATGELTARQIDDVIDLCFARADPPLCVPGGEGTRTYAVDRPAPGQMTFAVAEPATAGTALVIEPAQGGRLAATLPGAKGLLRVVMRPRRTMPAGLIGSEGSDPVKVVRFRAESAAEAAMRAKGEGAYSVVVAGERLALRCTDDFGAAAGWTSPGFDRDCAFGWTDATVSRRSAPQSFRIATGDARPTVLARFECDTDRFAGASGALAGSGAELPCRPRFTRPSPPGVATPYAEALGFARLVGFGIGDAGSLSHLAAFYAPPAAADRRFDISLTVESLYQRTAFEVLDAHRKSGSWEKGGDPDRRRIGLVVMEADGAALDAGGRRIGDVVAAAGHPHTEGRSTLWDLQASEAWQPVPNDNELWLWQQSDGFSAPGSTFKPVLGHALIRRARALFDEAESLKRANPGAPRIVEALERRNEIFDVVRGKYDKGAMRRLYEHRWRSGWDERSNLRQIDVAQAGWGCQKTLLGETEAQRNAQYATVAGDMCPDRAGFGICDMLRTSNNFWTLSVAAKFDADTLDHDAYRADHHAVADRLLITDATRSLLDLPRDATGRATARMDLDDGLFRPYRWPRHRMFAPIFDVDRRDGPSACPMVAAVNAAYGQSVFVSPVALAAIYTGLWNDLAVRPRLVRNDASVWTRRPSLDLSQSSEATMRQDLLDGMAAVVRNKGGTAVRAFRGEEDIAKLTWGKTGTAEAAVSRGKLLNTVWFASVTKAIEGRTLTIVCTATHMPQGSFGGSVCAPIVRDYIKAINAAVKSPGGAG